MKKKKNEKGCLVTIGILILIMIIGSLIPETEDDIYVETKKDFYSKARLEYRYSKYSEALTFINEAIHEDSTNSEYYELRGKILYELQDTLHSEEDFKRTLTLAKTDSLKDIRIKELINWDLQHGEKEKARELLKEEIKLYKNDSLKHIEIMEYAAERYLTIGDTLETINLYLQLSKDYKHTGTFYNKIGILYSRMHKNKSAILEFKKAVKIEPQNDMFIYNLGVGYLNRGSKQRAKKHFKKAAELGHKDACKEYRELSARTRYYQESRCCDGSTSSATGRGACSHHGGVCRILNIPYKVYTVECN